MSFLDLIFPKKCLECGRSGNYICGVCLGKVRVLNRLDRYNESYSVFVYEGVIRKAIIALKYKFAYGLAEELATAMVPILKKKGYLKRVVLVPIPLHPKRQNWRGFNQTIEVGKFLATKMGWKFMPDLLIRSLDSPAQVGLQGAARRLNIKGVFGLNSKQRISKKNQYVVFDDVSTTGSTLKEAAEILRVRGAKVFGLTIAK